MLAPETGLNWVQGFDAALSVVSLSLIVLSAALTSLFSSIKLRKMPPILALRGGSATGVLQRNIFPMEDSDLPLTLSLAFKTTYLNLKQNLLIMLILISVNFALVFCVVLSYNAPRDTFVNIVVGQYSDVTARLNPRKDAQELILSIRNINSVTEAVVIDRDWVMHDHQHLITIIMQDFSEILIDKIYVGRSPSHPNEVAIGGLLGEVWGKQIGDTLTLSKGEREDIYIITGFFQTTTNSGREIYLTADGFRLLDSSYKENLLFINLVNEANHDVFIEEMKVRYDDKLFGVLHYRQLFEAEMGATLRMINSLAAIITLITVLVVVFILFLVVRTLVIRRKQILGIQKAVGFTTFQLMNQIAGSFVPVAVLGTGIGAIIGCLTINDCIGFLLRGIGFMKADLYMINK